MTKEQATEILHSMVESYPLRRHCLSVSLVMEHYAQKYGEDPEEWAVAGLLHDADYEKYPEEHPNIIVKQLREAGEDKIANAIAAHYTKWNQPYNTLLDKALLACDELTGFIMAVCWLRPTKVEGLSVKSVKKRLKSKSFAAGVERSEVYDGVKKLGVTLEEHIAFIIEVLQQHKEALDLQVE